MRFTRIVAQLVILLGLASLGQIPHESAYAAIASQDVAVSPQYDTTHVYVAPEDFDRFVASLIATFGGTTTKQGVFTVTPTPSSTMSQLVLTPVGSISVFGFKTPIPYPFGIERTGYLVTDLDGATRAARAAGSDRTGRDHSVDWRCKHATVLAYNSAVLSWAPDYSRESRVRFGRQSRRVRA
jgi:hypothetical protein